MTTILAQAAGEPMTWWQALLTVAAIFAGAVLVVVLVYGRS